jgi:hypothetical protein
MDPGYWERVVYDNSIDTPRSLRYCWWGTSLTGCCYCWGGGRQSGDYLVKLAVFGAGQEGRNLGLGVDEDGARGEA